MMTCKEYVVKRLNTVKDNLRDIINTADTCPKLCLSNFAIDAEPKSSYQAI